MVLEAQRDVTLDRMLWAYTQGLFPMADGRESAHIVWRSPEIRGILPLDKQFHVPKRLARTVRSGRFTVTTDLAFADVVARCARPRSNHESTWINMALEEAYSALYAGEFAHSLEVWLDRNLVGGLYGVHLGGAFFGESMFSCVKDASKVALVHLVASLRFAGFSLLDVQYPSAHLRTFGCQAIASHDYLYRLDKALFNRATWCKDVALACRQHEITFFTSA